MRSLRLLTLAVLLALPASGQPYKEKAGPFPVQVVRYDWHDAERDRNVPVKIYEPGNGKVPFPVIVFSHGLGGSRENYEYLGRHWASHGYISVHLQHLGSDAAVWEGKNRPMQEMQQAAADPRNAIERTRDVRFALDRLEELNRTSGPLRGKLDMKKIGMAGHSFGAWTTLAVSGQTFSLLGREVRRADPRIRAAIAMSAPVSRRGQDFDRSYGSIQIPVLHMTGTRDESPIGGGSAADRRIPYDHIRNADQYLVTFEGGDHMVFSGRPRRAPGGEKDAVFQNLILQSTTAFWDAYLRGDAGAKQWLARGGFAAVMGKEGKLEEKILLSPASPTGAVSHTPARAATSRPLRRSPSR